MEAIEEIRIKIAALTELKNRDEMKAGIGDLQKALLENPTACSLMLPEDIGAAVAVIRVYVGKEVADTVAKKATSRKTIAKTDLSPEAVDALLAEEL